MPTLLPFAFAVVSGSDLVLLDVRSDAYALLMDAVVDGTSGAPLLLPLGVAITEDAASALADAGLVEADPPAPCTSRSTLSASGGCIAQEHRRIRPALRDLLDLLASIIRCRLDLRRGMPFRHYGRSRPPTSGSVAAVGRMLDDLRAARLVIPTPTRCLPASLVTSRFLARRGVRSEVVFGVRTHPFAAHCWVEVDGVIVDDDPDRVGAYLPICVARP